MGMWEDEKLHTHWEYKPWFTEITVVRLWIYYTENARKSFALVKMFIVEDLSLKRRI